MFLDKALKTLYKRIALFDIYFTITSLRELDKEVQKGQAFWLALFMSKITFC